MLRKDLSGFLRNEDTRMTNITRTVGNMDPANVLKRGYTITRVNGKAITSIDQVSLSDTIQTIAADGAIGSEVTTIKRTSDL